VSQAGYDLTIGISEEGVQREAAELVLPRYQHALIVFGGVGKVRRQGLLRGAAALRACVNFLCCCGG